MAGALEEVAPIMGLSPDPGFPIWLTPDPESYLPLRTAQTSGLDWVMSSCDVDGVQNDFLILVDDADEGGIHIVEVVEDEYGPAVIFHRADLTFPPPDVAGFPIGAGHGYDWESIVLHPWSGTVFLAHEGYEEEIALYHGRILSRNLDVESEYVGRVGEIESLPNRFLNVRRLELPGWEEAFSGMLSYNLGIEGLGCSEDRLFVALESPFSFSERLTSECSTVLAIWRINPDDPSDMANCDLLAVHDTADWEDRLGYRIETICGLDAIDSNRIVGIDRDNTRLFAIEFSDEGEFIRGRVFYLDVPGPMPLEADDCPELESLPRLVKPCLESIIAVPFHENRNQPGPTDYRIYLAVDPWGPGWSLMADGWYCQSYQDRLHALLPALYRYTVPRAILFPETETDLLLVNYTDSS